MAALRECPDRTGRDGQTRCIVPKGGAVPFFSRQSRRAGEACPIARP